MTFPSAVQRYREMAYCPRCGHAYHSADFHAIECLFLCAACGFDFYQNPVPAAVAVVTDAMQPGSVLMLKRSTPPGKGLWCVPGGFVRYGEAPEEAARREAHEEIGAEIDTDSVLCASLVDYAYRGRQICIVEIAYLARLKSSGAKLLSTTREAAALKFVRVGDLLTTPELLAFPEQASVLRALLARQASTR